MCSRYKWTDSLIGLTIFVIFAYSHLLAIAQGSHNYDGIISSDEVDTIPPNNLLPAQDYTSTRDRYPQHVQLLLDILYKKCRPTHLNIIDTLFYQFDRQLNKSTKYISKQDHDSASLELSHIETDEDFFVKLEGERLFAFNMLASNRVGLLRSLPDTRNPKCKHYTEIDNDVSNSSLVHRNEKQSSKASIIICYYNEAPSTLLRTIYSVLKRSPIDLIEEIIIVDDYSEIPYHIDRMLSYVNFPLLKMIRTKKREGLIRARLVGAQQATGKILIFLDSHVEANVGWLEPLLEMVESNNMTIACPMIDLINPETMIYSSSPMVKGGLDWRLQFKWDSVPSHKLKTYDDFVKPIEAPTMAGGLFAIDKEFFYSIGSYDAGMDLWGGENVELALRTWMCGGQVLILPCSRLGHIFRKRRPYGPDPGKPDSLLYNLHRTARVWLDEDWQMRKYYEASPQARNLDSGDVSDRIRLKHRMGCRNFTWFIDNIYTELKGELGREPEYRDAPERRNLFRSSRRSKQR